MRLYDQPIHCSCNKKCDLCLPETMALVKADPESLSNTSDEFVSKYIHINKFASRFFKKNKLY